MGLKMPLDIMTYDEAMARFGTDRPDRRFGMELVDLSNDLKGCGFNVFKQAISSGGIVKGLNLKRPKRLPRSRIDLLTDFCKSQGLEGPSYFKVERGGLSSPIAKFLSKVEKDILVKKLNAESGDLLLILAGEYKLTNEVLTRLRAKLASEEGLIKDDIYDFLWVKEFPFLHITKRRKGGSQSIIHLQLPLSKI
ncbi:TPA: hypothetical protein EYP27_02560 [Candidatus Bathyarchaeota archaeon]|nr:hypothetical protein [Candidatus Bathyarchaeota archaeon]